MTEEKKAVLIQPCHSPVEGLHEDVLDEVADFEEAFADLSDAARDVLVRRLLKESQPSPIVPLSSSNSVPSPTLTQLPEQLSISPTTPIAPSNPSRVLRTLPMDPRTGTPSITAFAFSGRVLKSCPVLPEQLLNQAPTSLP